MFGVRDPAVVADRLIDEHRGRQRFAPLGPEERAHGLEFAYDVQAALVEHLLGEGDRTIAGYKIGLTTPRMQALCGIDRPIIGRIFSDRVHHAPLWLQSSHFVRLGLEGEIAVRVAGHVTGSVDARSDAEMMGLLDGMCAAFEIVEDRAADYATLDAMSLIADNSWNAGIVLGEVLAPRSDLRGMTGRLWIDGELAEEASSDDVLGGPLQSVRTVAAHLIERGSSLRPGDWILTGSIITTKFPRPGSEYAFQVGSLPPIGVTIQ